MSGNCDDCKDFLRRSATRSGFRDRSICNATTDRPVVRAPSEDHLSSRPTARSNVSSAGLDSIGGSRKRRPGPRGKPPAGRPVRQDAKVLLLPASEHARQGRVRHAPALSRISLQDRIGSPSPAEGKNRCSLPLRWDRVFSSRVYLGTPARRLRVFGRPGAGHRIRWAGNCTQKKADARLGGRTQDRSSGADLRCWHRRGLGMLMPLSGAVIVPGTLVVESDVKKIQHPAGGVVANIPVRDGMHVRAGDCSCASTRRSCAPTLKFSRSSSTRCA